MDTQSLWIGKGHRFRKNYWGESTLVNIWDYYSSVTTVFNTIEKVSFEDFEIKD